MIKAERTGDGVGVEVDGRFSDVIVELEGAMCAVISKLPENERIITAYGIAASAIETIESHNEQVVDATALKHFLERTDNE